MQEKNQTNKTKNEKTKISVYKPPSPFERLRASCDNSYEALYRAVILQAIIDASGYYLQKYKTDKKNLKAYRDAYYWIFPKERERSIRFDYCSYDDGRLFLKKEDLTCEYKENSFEDICQRAGLEIKKTIDSAEKIIKNHSNAFENMEKCRFEFIESITY